jgi:hypothetical protein
MSLLYQLICRICVRTTDLIAGLVCACSALFEKLKKQIVTHRQIEAKRSGNHGYV